MKHGSVLSAIIVVSSFFISSQAPAQVSFFQPPMYAGYGNVFVADFNGDGKLDILSSDGPLNLGNGDGTFKQGTTVSGTPLAVADFNGDGKPDILEQGTGTLLVLLGNGDGTFQAPISTASGASLLPVAATDLNGDGKADVVGIFNNALMVYIGKGDGTFAAGVPYSLGVTPFTTTTLSFGDFNGDGKIDVAVSTAGTNVAGQEIVLLGNGDGTFQPAKTSGGVFYPSFAATGDFNGDGKLDIALSCTGGCESLSGSADVAVLLGNGDGTFQAPTVVFTGAGPLVAADVNGDGKVDLVLQSDPTVAQIYLGNGDDTFSSPDAYVLSFPFETFISGARGMAVADFNQDGKLDIAAGNAVLLGNGDGSFQGTALGVESGYPSAAVVGRFDNSAAPGVAVLSNQQIGSTYFYDVYIFSNNGSGQLSLAHTYNLQKPGQAIAAADFNGDGNLDLVVVEQDPISADWSYSILLGNGDGTFQSPVFYPQGAPENGDRISIAIADFNHDHKPDLALALTASSVLVLLGNGDGTFASPVSYYDAGLSQLLVADFNGDGNLDIAASGNSSNAETAILYGNGDGTFQAVVLPATLNGFEADFTGDLNNDGKADLVSSDQVALGNGDGTFTLLPTLPTVLGGEVGVMALADLNGDGIPDLVVSSDGMSGSPQETGILLGNGDGTFGSIIPVPQTGILPTPLIADMNGDNRPDFVFPWATFVNGIGVVLNTTSAGFELAAKALSPTPVTAGNSATSTVTVIPTFGFSSAVTLSCEGLPSGASCAFNPPSLANSSGTSTLTVSTTAGTAAGTSAVQVQGSAGSITSGLTLSLVVQAAPDFTIAPASGSGSSQTISAGQTASFSLTIAPMGSFTGTVNLACAVTPVVTPAPTCNLSSSSVQISGSGSQSVTVTVATTASGTSGTAPYNGFPTGTTMVGWAMMLAGLGYLLVRTRKRIPVLAAPAIMLAFLTWTSCGGGGSSQHTTTGTPSGTYTATVTATSGTSSHAMPLQVVVQ